MNLLYSRLNRHYLWLLSHAKLYHSSNPVVNADAHVIKQVVYDFAVPVVCLDNSLQHCNLILAEVISCDGVKFLDALFRLLVCDVVKGIVLCP